LVYQRAMESLNIKGIKKKDSYIGVFVKFEKLRFKSDKTPVPRVISPRKPRYNLELGTYIRPIEKRIYTLIDKLFGSKTVMKGLNMEQRGEIIYKHFTSYQKCVAISLDASRFDQHVSVSALQWEHTMYKIFWPRNNHFRKLLKWQLLNRGFAVLPDGRVSYTVKGKRQSGDVTTSLGNILIMCSIVHALAKFLEIDLKLVNDGDDCTVFMEEHDALKFETAVKEWFLEFGFNVVVEARVYKVEHVSFCQAQPVFDGSKYVMVRDPRTSIAKDCISLKPLDNDKITCRFAASIGLGGLSMVGGIPIVQEFYQSLVHSADGAKPLDDVSLRKYTGRGVGMSRHYVEPCANARLSFYNAFGVPPDGQVAIEEVYRGSRIGKVGDDGVDHITLPYL